MGGSELDKLTEVELVEELCQFNASASHSLGFHDYALTWNQLKDLSHEFKLCLKVLH